MIKLERKNILTIIFFTVIIIAAGYYIYSNYNNIFYNKEDLLEENIDTNNDTKENLQDNKKEIDEKILIHVSGAVQKEGIVELKEGSRVRDAVEEAGGLKEEACIKDINLAEMLQDGTKIYIPTIEEYNTNKESNNISNSYSTDNIQNKSNVTNPNNNLKVNINTANQSELEKLPGIGASTAFKIITYRKENGKFKSIEDIKKVNRNRRK